MPKDIVINMPTDMRNTEGHFSTFDLDYAPLKPGGITSLTVDIPTSGRIPNEPRPPPRWNTPEFIFYYVVALFAIPLMVWVPIHLSSPSHPNYPYYRHKLSSGWMFGREVDNSDTQYRSFRNNILSLSFLVLIFIALKYIYTRSVLRSASIPSDKLYLIPFFLAFSALYLTGLHGTSIFKILFILTANYWIAKTSKGSRVGPLLTWIFNVLILFGNETYGGYRYASLHPSLAGLDAFRGIYPRWHISFNITMLRLVSFNMDYYWAYNSRRGEDDLSSTSTEKQRANTPLPLEDYTYQNYIAYVLYPPLYIAGPILTFNNFMWQLRRPIDIPMRVQGRYLVRFLVNLLTMESILHYMYVVAIKDTKAWQGYTPLELSMIGFWNLIIVWLKLLLPWRFFRLWSLASGIDPPENMVRCVVNNYSTLGFWRSWHRSYNLWIVRFGCCNHAQAYYSLAYRYIYIPLGGAKNVALTTVLVFSFVALWHDLSFRLLAWGWLVSFFILPELLARYLLPQTKYGQFSWYRHVCAIGGVLNILMMVSANLVGFVIGTDGIMYMARQMTGTWQGFRFLLAASCIIFVGLQFMFEYREEEMRKGVYRRC